jgi:hypothetical protein
LVRNLAGSAAIVGLACGHTAPRGPVPTTKTARAGCADASGPSFEAELCAMGEPPLSAAGPESYRFVWLKHQQNPVAVRVARASSPGEIAVVSVEADAHDPTVKRRHEFTAAAEVWTALREHLGAADFWNLAGDPDESERGLDGADWIIEGRRGGMYHAVVRWEPKPGPFRAACEDLIKVAGLSFPAEIR